MHLPAPLYRALPATYLAAGLLTLAVKHDNAMAVLSGATLVCAGGVVAFWRHQHRARFDARVTARMAFESRKRRATGSEVQVG